MLESPKTYRETIECYALDFLKKGADLTLTPRGDLALTKDGGLKLGDDNYSALFRLTTGIRQTPPSDS